MIETKLRQAKYFFLPYLRIIKDDTEQDLTREMSLNNFKKII